MSSFKFPRYATTAYLGIVVGLVFVFSFMVPQNAWDLIGQLGSVISVDESDPSIIQEKTYKIARDTLDVNAYEELVSGSEERRVWAADHEAFNQLLPFYQPRVVLTHLVYAVYKMGVNPILAMRLISSFAACVGLIYLILLFRDRIGGFGNLLFPIVILIGGVLEVARFEGVDALGFCIFCALMYYLEKRRLVALAILAIVPAMRTDLVILIAVLLPYLWFTYADRRAWIVVSVAVSVVIYLLCNGLYGNYGWMKQFYVVHVQYLTHPADVETKITPYLYFSGLVKGSIKLVYHKTFHFFLLSMAVVLAMFFKLYLEKGKSMLLDSKIITLAILSAAYIFIHFIVFPSMNIRYFAGQFIYTGLASVYVLHTSITECENITRLDK